jgi:hypothetical protein
VIEKIIIAGVTAIFAAGVAWAGLKQLRKDVNGLGRKFNRMERAIMAFCPDDKREKIAAFLESGR